MSTGRNSKAIWKWISWSGRNVSFDSSSLTRARTWVRANVTDAPKAQFWTTRCLMHEASHSSKAAFRTIFDGSCILCLRSQQNWKKVCRSIRIGVKRPISVSFSHRQSKMVAVPRQTEKRCVVRVELVSEGRFRSVSRTGGLKWSQFQGKQRKACDFGRKSYV